MKKLVKIDLSKDVRDTVLDVLSVPEDVKTIKEMLKEWIPNDVYSDIEDYINNAIRIAMNESYEVGFQTAVRIMQGNLEFAIDIKE